MKRINLDKKSIVFRVTSLVIILIIAESILLTAFLILGGVLSQAEKNAYRSFADKVNNRKNYLESEMKNRWTNLDLYLDLISNQLLESEDVTEVFELISDNLISVMRTTQATGAFIILENESEDKEYPSLYLRDYDPILNDYNNKDLYMVFGPSDLAGKLKIPLDQMWKFRISMNDMDTSFYDKPYEKASLTSQSDLLGYWSTPFRLFSNDIPIITYTMPLFDNRNQLRGIIGIEIATKYFSQFLPSTDLQVKDSLGYFIGYEVVNDDGIQPILLTKEIQKRVLKTNELLSYTSVNPEENIYILNNHKHKNNIYICIEEMKLYNNNTPFQGEKWYLIGMMPSNQLLNYVYRIQQILWFSVLSSILIGIIGGYFISYRFTKPVILLANKVRNSNQNKKLKLDKTGLTEVDELSEAMQSASNALLESSVKMSRIIDLVELPIGAFEYREDSNTVFVTDQLQEILSIKQDEMNLIVHNKEMFIEKINTLLNHPDEEKDVYVLHSNPLKWIKMKWIKNIDFTIGVIMDVTDEMLEKKQILRDRDFDALTGIYNRKALQRKGEEILKNINNKLTSAVVMLDLDNLKFINDTFGHKWGDTYIRLAARHIEKISNERILYGRRSGDEFVVILFNYKTKEEIRACMQNFYDNLRNDILKLPNGSEKAISISTGLVWIENLDFTYDEYLHYADEALYESKSKEKGTFMEGKL